MNFESLFYAILIDKDDDKGKGGWPRGVHEFDQ